MYTYIYIFTYVHWVHECWSSSFKHEVWKASTTYRSISYVYQNDSVFDGFPASTHTTLMLFSSTLFPISVSHVPFGPPLRIPVHLALIPGTIVKETRKYPYSNSSWENTFYISQPGVQCKYMSIYLYTCWGGMFIHEQIERLRLCTNYPPLTSYNYIQNICLSENSVWLSLCRLSYPKWTCFLPLQPPQKEGWKGTCACSAKCLATYSHESCIKGDLIEIISHDGSVISARPFRLTDSHMRKIDAKGCVHTWANHSKLYI